MNGPLQERGSALDRDVTRANTLPADYDTDLESEWVNESMSLVSAATQHIVFVS